MKAILLVLALCAIVAIAQVERDDYNKFTQFIAQYNKQYATTAEWESRFSIFKQNLRKIEQLNGAKGVAHGITKFADMSAEEFKKYVFVVVVVFCGGGVVVVVAKKTLNPDNEIHNIRMWE